MKSKILLFGLLVISSFSMIAAKSLDQKQTLVIAYINSSADAWDAEIDHSAAKQLQKILQNINRSSSNKVKFDALIFPLSNFTRSDKITEKLFSAKYEKKFKDSDEVIFISLDHTNDNYNALEKALALYPHLKVPVVYNAGCTDLAAAKYWHKKGKAALYIGHVGISFSPAVYNAILEPMLDQYAQKGDLTESELNQIVEDANHNYAQESSMISSLIDPILGDKAKQKEVSTFHYDPKAQKITLTTENDVTAIESFQTQSRAYVTTPTNYPK